VPPGPDSSRAPVSSMSKLLTAPRMFRNFCSWIISDSAQAIMVAAAWLIDRPSPLRLKPAMKRLQEASPYKRPSSPENASVMRERSMMPPPSRSSTTQLRSVSRLSGSPPQPFICVPSITTDTEKGCGMPLMVSRHTPRVTVAARRCAASAAVKRVTGPSCSVPVSGSVTERCPKSVISSAWPSLMRRSQLGSWPTARNGCAGGACSTPSAGCGRVRYPRSRRQRAAARRRKLRVAGSPGRRPGNNMQSA
jgi:hypothetical protein